MLQSGIMILFLFTCICSIFSSLQVHVFIPNSAGSHTQISSSSIALHPPFRSWHIENVFLVGIGVLQAFQNRLSQRKCTKEAVKQVSSRKLLANFISIHKGVDNVL